MSDLPPLPVEAPPARRLSLRHLFRDLVAYLLIASSALACLIVFVWTERQILAIRRLTRGVGDTVFYARDGRAWFRLDESRRDVPLTRIAPHLRQAVVAVEDPNPLVAGRGIDHLRANGVEVLIGVRRERAAQLNRPFFTAVEKGRPFVTVKIALSLDARVAAAAGVRTRLTGEAAQRLVHRERAEVDAIAVGSGTILADDPLLTARGIYRSRPLARVIFDGRLRTPPGAKVLSTIDKGPVIIVTTASSVARHQRASAALQQAGARLQIHETVAGERPRIASALERLAADGVTSVVIEGGPELHRAAWAEQIVDRVQMFVAPDSLGPEGVPWVPIGAFPVGRLLDACAEPIGDDVLIEGYVHRAH